MHEDRLEEWGGSELVFLHETPVYEHPIALESRSTDVEMDVREVREVSSTWTLREQGEFFDRT